MAGWALPEAAHPPRLRALRALRELRELRELCRAAPAVRVPRQFAGFSPGSVSRAGSFSYYCVTWVAMVSSASARGAAASGRSPSIGAESRAEVTPGHGIPQLADRNSHDPGSPAWSMAADIAEALAFRNECGAPREDGKGIGTEATAGALDDVDGWMVSEVGGHRAGEESILSNALRSLWSSDPLSVASVVHRCHPWLKFEWGEGLYHE
ncbi:hypothetical protein BH23VER1_BH23VER1_35720 [soil metagenome]